MTDDEKTVPDPNEARRDDQVIHYHQVDETNVGDTDRSRKPETDETQRHTGRE